METVIDLLPSPGTIIAIVVTLVVVRHLLDRGESRLSGLQFRNQVVMLLLSAAIALSPTTVLGNAMAGIMPRAVRSLRMGDFVRTGEHFGRVAERGLFHTEIQTEDRELTTTLGYDLPRSTARCSLLRVA